jgi:hypothetical protein
MDAFVKDMLLDSYRFKIHFTKINIPTGAKYFVFSSDQKGNTQSFNMERNGTEWRIVNAPSVNELFLKYERRLSEVIKEHIKVK